MACTSPLEFWLGDKGSVSYSAHTEPFYKGKEYYYKKLTVPCGRCISCRQKYAYDWTARLLCEQEVSKSAYFITLTYDDLNVPFVKDTLTLRKSDFQNFMKRLRNAFPEEHIKYFAVGEYGSTSKRPHYHAIIFNVEFFDLVPSGYQMFSSKKLSDIWNKGLVSIQLVNPTTCRYVTGYMLKDTTSRQTYRECGIVPPFTLISKRPPIGYDYYLQHKDELANGSLIYCPDGTTRTSLACYDRFIKRDFGDTVLNVLKSKRRDVADLFSDDIPVFDKYDEYRLKENCLMRSQKKGAF